MNPTLKNLASRLPWLGEYISNYDALAAENDHLHKQLTKFRTPFAPGHFHSPIPDPDLVRANEAKLFAVPETIFCLLIRRTFARLGVM